MLDWPGRSHGQLLIREFVAKGPARFSAGYQNCHRRPSALLLAVAEWQRRPSVGRTIGEREFSKRERTGGVWVGGVWQAPTVTRIPVQKKKLHPARRRPSFDSFFHSSISLVFAQPPRPPPDHYAITTRDDDTLLYPSLVIFAEAALLIVPRELQNCKRSQVDQSTFFSDSFPNLTAGNSHHGRRQQGARLFKLRA